MAIAEFDRLIITPRRTDAAVVPRPVHPRDLRVDPRGNPIDDQEPGARSGDQDENLAARSPSLMILVLIATIGVLAYSAFLLNPANRGDLLPYLMVITAETVLVVHAILSMWTVLSSGSDPRDFAFHHAYERLHDVPEIIRDRAEAEPERWRLFLHDRPVTVDVFITTYGEDLGTIRRTVTAALAIRGAHNTWVLDDGRSDEVRDLAAELGARYVRRLSSGGAKAGNVNHALSLTSGDFFAIFDADFVPRENFLIETLPFFVHDDTAFVQTPQTYGNLKNLVSRGAGYMQAVFYRFIQPGRNRFNAAFCVGTNVIFRRAAINDIGGIYTDSKSEDVWTSLLLHERGWRSTYIPMTLAVGDTPETIEDYTKQQLRWATGGFEILLRHNPLSRKRRLTTDQRLQYFVTSTHYLTGICPLLLLALPPLMIYLDLAPMNLTIGWATWLLFYAGFYVMQIAIAFYTLGSFRWEVLMLATVSFPIYARALWNAIRGKEQSWHVTGAKGRRSSPFNFIVPQVLFFVFLLLTSVVGGLKDLSNGQLSLAMAWNTTSTLILGAFMVTALREAREIRRANAEARRAARRKAARLRGASDERGAAPHRRESADIRSVAAGGAS